MARRVYLNDVYAYLTRVYPRPVTEQELNANVVREQYQSPARFTNIPLRDTRFVIAPGNPPKLYLPHPPPSPGFDPQQRAEEFYSRLRTRFSSSSNPMRLAPIRQFYVESYSTELHFNEIRRILMAAGRWIANETGRIRVYFDFMITNMAKVREARKDKNGIVVVQLDPTTPGLNPDISTFQVQNNSDEAVEVYLPTLTNLHFSVEQNNLYPQGLPASQSMIIEVFCETQVPGIHLSEITFRFNIETREPFHIIRSIIYSNQDKELRQLLQPNAPYQPRRRTRPRNGGGRKFNLSGDKPPSTSKKFVHNVEEFPIPENYFQGESIELETDNLRRSYEQLFLASITPEINMIPFLNTYYQVYRSMLFFEEKELQNELDNYASENVSFVKSGNFYWLDVPGLAEKRPSVLRGDEVEARLSQQNSDAEVVYRGFVWNVEQTRIQISFHSRIAEVFSANTRFDVRYLFKRTNIRIMHDTLKRISDCTSEAAKVRISSLLYPKQQLTNLPQPVLNNLHLPETLNNAQKLALNAIIGNTVTHENNSPFVLFGPPGTGKTHTLTHAIMEIMRLRPQSKLLVLAPSNQAADLLVEKLSRSFSETKMFRLMSYQRDQREVSSTVLRYCQLVDHSFLFPAVSSLETFNLIVSTCSMSSKLFYYGFPSDYFDTIIIDESGHCWEPEALAGFMNFYSSSTGSNPKLFPKLVLAGDPQQLGPVVRADQSKAFGLALSLLERLTKHVPAYAYNIDSFPDTAGYNPKYIVELLECYRCHPVIMELPNHFFYHNSLISSASATTINTFLNWDILPNNRRPMIFHGCVGQNEQESNSPSWFNSIECELVLYYIRKLSEARQSRGFQLKDIGIITPYHKQVQKIRKAIQTLNLPDRPENKITVGSCEQFQGQERKVIIISTVRSSTEQLENDEYFNIGFVNNPKRFNVAITRSQALVIVIGNPNALNFDQHWGGLLWHCVDNECYTGCELPTERRNEIPTEV